MYIIKNALKNLMRNKGRNLLMMIIVLAIMVTTSIALIINNTATSIIDDYKNKFGSEVTIGVDINKVMEARQQGETLATSLDNQMMLDFADSEYLKGTTFTAQLSLYTENLIAVDQDEENNNSNRGNGGFVTGGQIQGGGTIQMAQMPNVRVIGDSNTNDLTEFNDGTREISEGRMYENENEVIISSDLAELNELTVGDVITLEATNYNDEENSVVFELTIVGIYYDATSDESGMGGFKVAFTNRKNEILTSFETLVNDNTSVLSGGSVGFSPISVTAVYYLNSPSLIDEFESEVRAKGLGEWFNVSTDEFTYNAIVGPVEGLKSITFTFMLVVLVLGGIILILLSSLAMRERKYEVGVLRAIGMKKVQVVAGLMSEMLTITLVCLVLGLGIGTIAAQPISNYLLENQIAAQQNENNNPSFGNGPMNTRPGGGATTGSVQIIGSGISMFGSDVETIDKLDVGIDLKTALELAGIALALASLASIVGVTYITRYEPIKILSERN